MKRSHLKKTVSLLVALLLAVGLTQPVFAVKGKEATENIVSATAVTGADLPAFSVLPEGVTENTELTVQEVIVSLLMGSGLTEEQLGQAPDDYNAFAKSLGMIDGSEDLDAICTTDQLDTLTGPAQALYDALHREDGKLVPLFLNGRAQPIFPYTSGAVSTVDNSAYARYGGHAAAEEPYDNANSDIIRYFVYVETNYDTDGDGKLDLVKALVQVPRAAAEGDYQAATIFEARPYITGCTTLNGRDSAQAYTEGEYDYNDLYSQPDKRVPSGEPIGTLEAAAGADSNEWYYWNPYENMYDYEDLDWYDYYLVRGFAVVESGGIGTRGSEGFETCGTDLEIDAFKCIIEWLHGDRVAYTDKTDNIPVKADWSAGSVGMTGRSYAGTTQFGLSTTGVEGLKTIVPVAGIASWYEYTNFQGIQVRRGANYVDTLAAYCAGRYLDPEDWAAMSPRYTTYLYQLRKDQLDNPGDYFDPVWTSRDYTLNADKIKIPALIVHGLNDDNVRTKESDLMYQAFQKAGQDVKFIFHQDGHLTPTYPAGGIEFLVGGQLYDEILNQWFSHYLCDVDNDAENMPAVLAQSNQDPDVWNTYDSWEAASDLILNGTSKEDITISSNYSSAGVTSRNWRDKFTADSTGGSAMFKANVEEDTVIKGAVAVNFTASVSNVTANQNTTPRGASAANEAPRGVANVVDHDNYVNPLTFGLDQDSGADLRSYADEPFVAPDDGGLLNRDSLMVSAMLVDLSAESFPTVSVSGSYVPKQVLKADGAWQGGGLKNWDFVRLTPTNVKYKIIARGWMDLCNPDAGYDSASAATKVNLVEGQTYNYTIYLQPNLYTVPAGHQLAVVIYAYEPGTVSYTQNYAITLQKDSVVATIPVDSGAGEENAYHEFVNLTVNAGEHGSVSATEEGQVGVGAEVTLTARPEVGYRLDGWTVNGEDAGNDINLTLTIEEDTVVEATFVVRNSSGIGGGDTGDNTPVDNPVDAPEAENGNVSVSPESAKPGEQVTVTLEPDSGYEADTVTVTDEDGKEIPVTENSDGTYTFTMPEGKVTVTATFAKSEEDTQPVDTELPFTDVAEDSWYYDDVAYAYDKGLMKGTGETTFAPDLTTTRGMIITILYRLEKEPAVTDLSTFNDVEAGAYYADAVAWAQKNNIASGYSATTFGPNDPITREQLAIFLYRFAQFKAIAVDASGSLSKFKDAESVSDYAVDAMTWACNIGLINGDNNGNLLPQGNATRAQAAAVLHRAAETMNLIAD